MNKANLTKPDDCAFASDVSCMNGAVGLTKREYFAGLAMQGILGNYEEFSKTEAVVAEEAVGYADALINELNKGQQ